MVGPVNQRCSDENCNGLSKVEQLNEKPVLHDYRESSANKFQFMSFKRQNDVTYTENLSNILHPSHSNTMQLQPVADPLIDEQYRDSRGGPFTLQALGDSRYQVVNEPFSVRHLPATDRYLMAGDDIFWDPLTGDAFTHTGGINYLSMSNDPYVYSHGYYMPDPAASVPLTAFLARIWGLRNAIGMIDDVRARLNMIYNIVYSKRADNAKQAPLHKSPTISALVNFSAGKNAHLQFGVAMPNGDRVSEIQKLYQMMTYEPYTEEVKMAAYQGLSRGYYYYLINGGVVPDTRIILNVSPTAVPAALTTLYPIVSHSDLVQGMKAGGPVAAVQKLDSIIIYAARGDGFQDLLDAITGAGIATIDLLPGLTAEQAQGIALADEPAAVGGVNISFGQKRVILAYMALSRSNSAQMFGSLARAYFQQAGIDTGNAAEELDAPHNPAIENELGQLLGVMNG